MSSKIRGKCPDCGADFHSYRYFGLSKGCSNCGRNNQLEDCVKLVASIKRNGGSMEGLKPDWSAKVEEYRLSRVRFFSQQNKEKVKK